MVGVTRDICETIIEQYEPAPEAREKNFMTVDGTIILIVILVQILTLFSSSDINLLKYLMPRETALSRSSAF